MTKFYALNSDGNIVFIGEFNTFCECLDGVNDTHLVWICDEETIQKWKQQIEVLINN